MLILVACDPTGYTLRGTIQGLPDTRIYLQKLTPDGFIYFDSTDVNHETFTFAGKPLENPTQITIFFKNPPGQLELLCSSFYLENATITLTGSLQARNHIKIAGSKENEVDKAIQTDAQYPVRYEQIQQLLYTAQRLHQTLPDDSVAKWHVELQKMTTGYANDLLKAIKKHPTSYVALFKTLENVDLFDIEQLKELKEQVSPQLHHSQPFQELSQIVSNSPITKPGAFFKDFVLSDSLHKSYTLASFKGKIVLIDFWASWCGPCRQQLPDLKELYKKLPKDRFEILAISIDDKEEAWKTALIQEAMPWPNVRAENSTWAKNTYLVTAVPCNFLLDGEGKIVARDIPLANLEQKVKQLSQ